RRELFLARPERASPYSPSSRLALNPLYLDVEAIDGYADCAEARALVASDAFAARIAALRSMPFVDYAGVWSLKCCVLTLLFRHSCGRHRAFAQHAATFDALQAKFGVWGWPAWPEAYRDRA